MLRVNKILFPTDFSTCANQALNYALLLARQLQAELHFFHAIILNVEDPHDPSHHFPGLEEIDARLRALAATEMAAAISRNRAGDVRIVQEQRRGVTTAPTILEYAVEQGVDLIVMGTHGRRGLGHLFLGSVAEEVVRLSSCPVLTVRERRDDEAPTAMDNILVPVDFSEHSRGALHHAREIAAVYGARLQLVHVVEDAAYPAFYMAERLSYFDLVPDLERKSRHAMTQLLADTPGPDVAHECHVLTGRTAHEIAAFAERHASDLIVIATHGLTGLQHLLLGSVTERVVRQATCPVMTVKAFGKSLIAA